MSVENPISFFPCSFNLISCLGSSIFDIHPVFIVTVCKYSEVRHFHWAYNVIHHHHGNGVVWNISTTISKCRIFTYSMMTRLRKFFYWYHYFISSNAFKAFQRSLCPQWQMLQTPDIQHIIPSHETISVLPLQLPINVLLRLFKCHVHIPIQACQETFLLKCNKTNRIPL